MKIYKSKIGPELSVPIFGFLIILETIMAFKGVWIGVGIVSLIFLFILHLFITTYYQIVGHELKIKSGFFVAKTLQIDSIRKIAETRNPISSPALSLDRIELKYNRFDSILISPNDKTGFISDLLLVRPEIEVQLTNKHYLSGNFHRPGAAS